MVNRFISLLILGVYFLIYPLFISGECHADSLYSELSFADIYHKSTEGTYNQYLYHYRWTSGWTNKCNNTRLVTLYSNEAIRGRFAYYPDVHNRIDFEAKQEHLQISYSWLQNSVGIEPKLYLGSNMGFGISLQGCKSKTEYSFESSTQQHSASFDYSIEKESGNIPFRWVTNSIRVRAANPEYNASLSATDLSPLTCDGFFANNLDGFIITSAGNIMLPKSISASIQATYMDLDADLRYKSSLYGKISNLRALAFGSKLQKTYAHADIDLGLNALICGIGSDSYIDIWPFTYLDTFLAHRTRIKQLGIRGLSPSIGVAYHMHCDNDTRFNYNIGITYHHLFHKEDVVIRNRKAVLYPILFTYTTSNYNWQDDLDAFIRIPVQASYNFGRVSARIHLLQVMPFKWSDVMNQGSASESPAQAGTRQWQWGGLSCGLEFDYAL